MKTTKNLFLGSSVVLGVGLLVSAYYWPVLHWLWLVLGAYIFVGTYDLVQKKHTLLRLYPVVGHIRFLFESIRPEIQQYFVEDDTSGMPVSREFRSLIYQRAKGQRDTRPFGTVFDTYRVGYEWVEHSLSPVAQVPKPTRVSIGSSRCRQPYSAARFNISAMSYGALSQHAIRALNKGAKIGNFSHNTGEGGLSPYHLMEGGDLIWQIGTGYFSCRTKEGGFDSKLFREKVLNPQVKMVEIKLSQGAKPGHGGILPAVKLTKEIAEIRVVEMGKDVFSPSHHSAFNSPLGLIEFIEELRELSEGKPIGFKLSIGRYSDFIGICKAMKQTGITPDFITIDGGEGGTGAAPIEFTNSVGSPLREALHFVHSTLIGFGLRSEIKLIASGKVFSAFHVMRVMALGADLVNSARGMMFALGCIQSRQCHSDTCPTGIATQDPRRYKALDIDDKAERVARYQASVLHHMMELVAALGIDCPSKLNPAYLKRRVAANLVMSYQQLYPVVEEDCLLEKTTVPENLLTEWEQANAYHW
ncbi:MAG: FMN-binding glutamate synthase family protein [Thiomicrospira sp.]|uniref:FMN-binding glutamate synthase family protein n=1 Tax=Thiomicrospira sp. TaxID=935 RepID=UPI001A0969CA|nr:FMN-binding glutamate synthase family protein [Thiomicrospira sp.]MBE0494206.1 FMN-binding glutamate synthase family protein [Thiomicrospira sp.]